MTADRLTLSSQTGSTSQRPVILYNLLIFAVSVCFLKYLPSLITEAICLDYLLCAKIEIVRGRQKSRKAESLPKNWVAMGIISCLPSLQAILALNF